MRRQLELEAVTNARRRHRRLCPLDPTGVRLAGPADDRHLVPPTTTPGHGPQPGVSSTTPTSARSTPSGRATPMWSKPAGRVNRPRCSTPRHLLPAAASIPTARGCNGHLSQRPGDLLPVRHGRGRHRRPAQPHEPHPPDRRKRPTAGALHPAGLRPGGEGRLRRAGPDDDAAARGHGRTNTTA